MQLSHQHISFQHGNLPSVLQLKGEWEEVQNLEVPHLQNLATMAELDLEGKVQLSKQGEVAE